ncbi:myosin phosphatase Rho-interacting protein-like [Poecilia latipinna]|uniref:myosin phosphatase Rho-interacting protein-like n=1 Tax=Poecilia formosa TaxID=48698 RepID=UPI0004439AC1|nr:PREDICTED: myosin phosphatase Rho-interacting protein-like [Poecilia formosa]XP_014912745.1 PREDICTED: myosin phosphatase Rho-interacting protein-like [Poecilia latipinna]
MSAAKENTCRKFQANFFNKSKCQNCFKPRELHLLTDQDLTQAKPIYAGWLCLAPEGTDFDNPMQRSRKWQRRFFVLYEHGCLRFALDESVSENSSHFGFVEASSWLKLWVVDSLR